MRSLPAHIKKKAYRILLLIGFFVFINYTDSPAHHTESQKPENQISILISSPRAKKQSIDNTDWIINPQQKEPKKHSMKTAIGQSEKIVKRKNILTADGMAVMQFFLIILGITTIWLFGIALGEAIEESLDWKNRVNL